MDVDFFLRRRTAFIRQFYDTAAAPFAERKRKIEEEEEPFVPPYSEDGEPPFLEEWCQAKESLQLLGYSCISMLSTALHLYLRTWEEKLRLPANVFKAEFKKGWLSGYKAYFAANLGVNFDDGPADLSLLEEVVLARNQVQHPNDILNQLSTHPAKDRETLSRSFFLDDREREMPVGFDASERTWSSPHHLHVSGDKLTGATAE